MLISFLFYLSIYQKKKFTSLFINIGIQECFYIFYNDIYLLTSIPIRLQQQDLKQFDINITFNIA